MFSIRAMWQQTTEARNAERLENVIRSLKNAEALHRDAADKLALVIADLQANVKDTGAVVAPEFTRGQTGNLAQFVGNAAYEASREAFRANEAALEAATYAGGFESMAVDK